MTTIHPDTVMRHIAHYAEDTATLHKYELGLYRDDEQAARWRRFVDRRRAEVRAEVDQLATTSLVCEQIVALVLAGVRDQEIHRRSAQPLLEVAGLSAAEATERLDAAEEGGPVTSFNILSDLEGRTP